jgi:Flp pilus assembly pilin Flp
MSGLRSAKPPVRNLAADGYARTLGSLLLAVRQPAQDVIEYGVIIATIAVVVLLGVTAFGNQVEPWFLQLAGHVTTVGT